MEFFEYTTLDGTAWRVEEGRGLAAVFDLEQPGSEMPVALAAWHEALCPQGATWEILCRLFAVNPAFGEDDIEKLRPWPPEQIARKAGLALVEVERHLEEARTFWQRWRQREHARLLAQDAAPPEPPAAPAELSPAEIDALLGRHGFGMIEGEGERAYIARRIEDLAASLDDGQSRTVAVSMIQQEVNILFGLDPMVSKLRKEIRDAGGASTESLEGRLMKLTKSRADAQTALEKTRETLGMNEAQTGSVRVKVQAQATMSSYVEAVRRYHARGDRELIDGIFTAQEIELLTTEYTIRPSQYRPDLVATLNECLTPKALFDPAYKPPAFARKAVQRLRRGFQLGLAEARNEAGEVVGDLDDESREEIIDQATRDGERGVGTLGTEGVSAQAPVVKPASRPERAPRGRNRGDELADF